MAEVQDAHLVRCTTCGATNRISKERLTPGKKPICGRCKSPLSLSSGPFTVTDATFETEVERSAVPVLLDLWAPWCGPCLAIAPMIESLANEMAGRVRVAKLNVDENPLTASRLRVQGIPTLLVFRSGREVDRLVGIPSKAEVVRRLERAIS
jgi:thioredoxin 2